MRLWEATYRAIANRRWLSPATERPPANTGQLVTELQRSFGTHPPPGVAERTWRRARHQEGWKPTPRVLGTLRDVWGAVTRRGRLAPGRESWLRSPADIGIDALVRVSSDERDRRILVTRWPSWNRSWAGLMVDRFLARNDAGMGAPIMWALRQEVPDMELLDVHEVRFFQTSSAADEWRKR